MSIQKGVYMILGLFEGHINVSNLERSSEFYEKIFGDSLILINEEPARRSRFYWVGGVGKSMLGLRENYTQMVRQHFAFQTTVDGIRNAEKYLRDKGVTPTNFYGEESSELYVFAAMPAVSIFFTDPDNHSIEFIAMLEGEPRPELGIIPWSEWNKLNTERKPL